MKIEKIKPIPQRILSLIKKKDNQDYPSPDGNRRFYSYLTKNDGELVKVTVAVKNRYSKWYCKQVAVHGVNSKECFVKDMCFYYIGGYVVGWFEEGLSKDAKWYEGSWGWTSDDQFDPHAPVVNPEYALTIPKYKYSAVDKYGYVDIIKYLRLYEKYPQMEYITKLGLQEIVTSKQVLNLASKDKKFRKWLSKKANEIKIKHLYISAIIQAYKLDKSFDEVQAILSAKKLLAGKYNYREIKEEFKGETTKLISYIGKQNTSLSTYEDYFKACMYLQLDMKDTKNRYPIDFKYWHNIRIDEYQSEKAKKDAILRKETYEKFAIVSDKYLPLQRNKGAYVVIIAKSPAELTKEGEILHHCVGGMGYDQKFTREESLIFFVRKLDDVDTPFVTLEYSLSSKKILQCYAAYNKTPEKEVLNYVNEKWLPYANRKLNELVA